MHLLQHFHNLTKEPKNAKELKGLILQLAVQGKLTAQWRAENPNQEPATELLKRIAKEKAELVEAKKIRKEKPLSAISEEEKPYELPDGWNWSQVGKLSTIKGGKRIPKGYQLSEEKTPYGYIRVTDMKNGTILTNKLKYITENIRDIIKQYTISKNDLYITIAGTIGDVGKVPDEFDNMNLTENAAKIILYQMNKKYLKLVLNSNLCRNQFLDKVNQMAQPKLALHRIASTIIPLPPLSEQKAIVEVVEKLFKEVESLEELTARRVVLRENFVKSALAELATDTPNAWAFLQPHFPTFFAHPKTIKQLREAVLQLAVQGKLTTQWRAENPDQEPATQLLENIKSERLAIAKSQKEREKYSNLFRADKQIVLNGSRYWIRAELVCDFITKGTTPKKHEFVDTGEIPFLKVYNIVNNKIDFLYKPQYVRKDIHDGVLKRSKLLPGDVIMNIVGPPLGKIAIIPDEFPEWNMNQALAVFRPIPHIINSFLFLVLLEGTAIKSIATVGTAGQDNISLTQSRDLMIPLFSIPEQKAIVAQVDALMAFCDSLEQLVGKQTLLSERLMQSAVREVLA
jgi:type I restriction enzyme S subunit